jgi:hypothetical protein
MTSPATSNPNAGAASAHPFVGVFPVDVVDRGGTGRRIAVRVDAAAPCIPDPLTIVARFRLAGELRMVGGDFPRAAENKVAEFLGHAGCIYRPARPWMAPGSLGHGSAEPFELCEDELRMLAVRPVSRENHAATGLPVSGHLVGPPEPWSSKLAERYDLRWAVPVVEGFKAAVSKRLLVAGGTFLKADHMPVWWANPATNQISLDEWRANPTYLRDADHFAWSSLDSARRYLAALGFHQGEPEILGGIDFVDPSYGHGDDLRSLCSVVAPWVARRWARHLADLPADLVRHCHDAANWSDEAFPEKADVIRLASALTELLARSGPLPDVRRGEWPQQAVDALRIRLHAVEGVQPYGAKPSDGTPYGPRS